MIILSLKLSAAINAPSQIQAENLISGQPQTVVLNKDSEKGSVIIFMSAKCPCSNSHVEIIKKLAAQNKNFQFVVIHSNSDESTKEAADYFKKTGFSFPVLQDDGAKIADQFKAFKTPHAFVLDPKGNILYQGGVTDSSHGDSATKNYLANALADISENKPVQITNGRTLGCVILRKE